MDLNTYLDPTMIEKVRTGGYALMLILMIVEGPVVTFIAGFLASLGVFDIWIVFLFGWLGDVLGDLLFYSIGRYGLGIFKGKTTAKSTESISFIQKLDHLIHTNLILAILIIKFTPYAPPIGLTYIGKIKVNIKKYLLYSMSLCIPIPLVSGLVGYHIGSMNNILNRYSGTTLILALIEVVCVIMLAIGLIIFLKKKSEKVLENESTSDENEKNTTIVR